MCKKIIRFIILIFNFHTMLSANTIEVGFNKANNIWNFIGNADINFSTQAGDFNLKNIYQGVAVDNIDNSFRDAENFTFNYNYSIYKNLFVDAEANLILLTDQRIAETDNLIRKSALAGLFWQKNDLAKLRFIAGIENNRQVGQLANGFIFKSNGFLNEYDFNSYKLNSKLDAEFLFLNDNRQSKDLDIDAQFFKDFDEKNLLFLNLRYKLQGRDFLQNILIDEKNPIETHNENRIEGNIKTKLEIYEFLFINIEGALENINILKNFNHSIPDNNNSFVNRIYNELNLNLKINFDYLSENLMQNGGILIAYRDESNYINEKYEISDIAFSSLQNFELQKDNLSTNIRLFYKNQWLISKKNTIQTDISFSKLEYNTPSNQNNDDRDEVSLLGYIKYHHTLSDILSMYLQINYSQNHMVFIKKERSSQNNWNRVLSLQSGITYSTDFMNYSPVFEVLANYTVYDFETVGKSIKSYSFRQISYKDSLKIDINSLFFVTNRTSIRYYEQGKLYWASFSEIPQQGNLEISSSPMFNYMPDKDLKLGVGCKLFWLNYGQISLTNSTLNNQKTTTYSPAISAQYKLNKIILNCSGWMEYKYINEKYSGFQPNLFLSTTYKF